MSFRERRTANRIETKLIAFVKGRESTNEFWKEETKVITVSKIGAGFYLRQKVPVGRLVLLDANLSENLRQYDRHQDTYRVWGLVQHASYSKSKDAYHVGIAFIGRDAPSSYLEDPGKTYRVVGLSSDGFWSVGETQEPFVKRQYHRFTTAIPVKVYLEQEGVERIKMDWDAVTENVSAGGASIYSSLEVNVSDPVRIVFEEPQFESIAIVVNRQFREQDKQTIHVEFVEPNFPVQFLEN